MFRRFLPALLAVAVLPQSIPAQSAPQATSGTPTAAAAKPEAPPAWEAPLEARIKELSDRNGPGTDAPLREQLLKMLATDQSARQAVVGSGVPVRESMQKLTATDTELTGELKQIVEQKGWPTIALVGIDASTAAMTILTHTPDHAWQLQLLPQLTQMADAGKIEPSNLALVIDKELVSEGKLQRYGSQFKVVNGGMAMYGVEDPGGLDQRRAKALLPPIQAYEEMLEKMYHLKVNKVIVSATPPSAKPQD